MSDESSTRSRSGKPGAQLSTGTELMQRWVIVRHTTAWHPPTDVYELNDRLVVVVEIAGMRDGDFNVTLQEHRLTISGTRRRVTGPDCAYYQLEIPFGEFRAEVELPWSVAREDVSATYRDGFLRVELPHASAQQVQIVNVDIEDLDHEQPDID